MPKHGDIIIIHNKRICGPSLVRCGVLLRLDHARRPEDFRFTEVATGKAVDGFAWSLRHACWAIAA